MSKPFKVFGIGLNKTGTTSLKIAFRRLGFDHSKREAHLAKSWLAGDIAAIFEEADKHESFEDWPWPLAYRELYDRYGDSARYILTTRASGEKWVKSLQKHAERTAGARLRKAIYGYEFPHGVEAEHIAFYDRHNADIRTFFADKPNVFADFCWENGDGWIELCRFLNEPMPRKPFPHGNAGKDARPKSDLIERNQQKIERHLRRIAKDR